MRWTAAVVLAIGALILLGGSPVSSASQRSIASGVYTDAQAQRGETPYANYCGFCHGGDLGATVSAPAITGAVLVANWNNRPVSDVFRYIQNLMPWNSPGGLSPQQNADIFAYMLKKSGFPSGGAEFSADPAAQNEIVMSMAKR